MTNEQRMLLVKSLFSLIFTNKRTMDNNQWGQIGMPPGFAGITLWNPRTFVNGTLRGIDIDINTNGQMLQLRFLEQNPNKVDMNGNLKPMAIEARNGQLIMWVIDKKKQTDGFLGRIQNGEWIPSQMRAHKPAQYNQQGATTAQPALITNNVPDIPGNINTEDYVVQSFDDPMNDVDSGHNDVDPGYYEDSYDAPPEDFDEPF